MGGALRGLAAACRREGDIDRMGRRPANATRNGCMDEGMARKRQGGDGWRQRIGSGKGG